MRSGATQQAEGARTSSGKETRGNQRSLTRGARRYSSRVALHSCTVQCQAQPGAAVLRQCAPFARTCTAPGTGTDTETDTGTGTETDTGADTVTVSPRAGEPERPAEPRCGSRRAPA